MDEQEIKARFIELTGLMSDVKTHCDSLIKEFPSNSSEHKTVSRLIVTHQIYQDIILGSSHTDDHGMAELATDVRTYCKVINVSITKLHSACGGMQAYNDLVNAYSQVEDWYKNVLDSYGLPAPVLTISPPSLPTNYIISGETASSQPITISNTGIGTMIWNAQLGNNPPAFITLSAQNGSLEGGKTFSINVKFNAKELKSGTTTTTNVTINATDSGGKLAKGSPASLPVNVTVTDNLFMCVMNQLFQNDPSVIIQTQSLFENKNLRFSDDELNKLTDSWQTVADFVANPSEPCSCLGSPKADLIVLNSQLEELYDKIESYVTIK